ncbi:MAG TPA: WYL domain-containing protein [Ktedonobacterales bacterium]|jgi:CRISPR-associated endonuclease/helicase Cas3
MPEQESVKRVERLVKLVILFIKQPERHWRTSEIAKLTHVSIDTAFRDLQDLSRTGALPLSSEGTTRDFVWFLLPESQAELPPLRLEYAEGAAMYAALKMLSQLHDGQNAAVNAAILHLIGVLPTPLRPHLEAIAKQQEQPAVAQDHLSNLFEALSQGWVLRRVVKLHYEPLHLTPYTCQFHPYLLEPSAIGRTLYFIGYSDPPKALRTYKLERVRYAELTKEPFEIPDDFDGLALLRKAWGVMYGDGEVARVKLHFTQFVSKRVRETRWHPSETVTHHPGGLLWEADISDVTEIRPWIRSWGADCEVLEPASLRKELIREAQRFSKLYGIEPKGASGTDREQSLFEDLFGEE